MEQILFLILAAGGIFSGANVVFRRNPAICAVFLVATFVCVSGMFLVLGFPFMAALQLMVYAGAIMVLFLFVVMLLNLEQESPQEIPYKSVAAPLLGGALLGLCAVFLIGAKVAPAHPGVGLAGGRADAAANGGMPIAEALFGRWLVPFEATSLLLLAALLGVIVLGKRMPATRGTRPPPGLEPEPPQGHGPRAAGDTGSERGIPVGAGVRR